jgi:hypothetical protein
MFPVLCYRAMVMSEVMLRCAVSCYSQPVHRLPLGEEDDDGVDAADDGEGGGVGCQYCAFNPTSTLLAATSDSMKGVFVWEVATQQRILKILGNWCDTCPCQSHSVDSASNALVMYPWQCDKASNALVMYPWQCDVAPNALVM